MNKEQEIWKPVKDFEGLYEVSNQGRVRSLNYRNQNCVKVMSPNLAKNGYLVARLMKDGRKYHLLLHRLVAQSFIEKAEGLYVVNHKDENKTNNHVSNLEWCTQKYNMNYGSARVKISKSMSKRPVAQYDKEGRLIAVWKGVRDAGVNTGIDRKTISLCCIGKYKQAGGYVWQYIN